MKYRTLLLLFCSVVCAVSCTKTDTNVAASHTLRIGVSDEPDSLNPLFSHSAIADDIAALILAPLFRYDDTGTMVAELASRVPSLANGDIAPGGRRIVLRLRHHLRWSDGQPLTSKDLVFTWRAVMNPANNTKLRSGWDNISAIKTPDENTAIVELRRPDATVLTLFAGGGDAAYPPLPAHLFAAGATLNTAAFNAAPISSGPWLLTAWQHGSSLSFHPNALYWRGAPKISELKFVVYPQADTLMTALQTSEIDYVDTVPENRLAILASMPKVKIMGHTVATYRHLDFNLRDPLLRDNRVRVAIIEGVQWDRILSTVYHGAGSRAVSDIFPSSFAAPHLLQYEFDPRHAARLLDAAGWKQNSVGERVRGGVPLALTIMSANTKETSAQAELQMAADLQRIGIRLQSKNLPTNYLFAQTGPLYTGRYQLAWAADTRGPDPDNAANWITAAQPPNGGNTVFLSDAVVDRTATAARLTLDPLRRRALYQEEAARLHLLAPSFIFTWQRATAAMTARLHGVRPAPFYSNFWNSWQWRLQ